MDIEKSLGKRIARERQHQKLSQPQLAEMADIDVRYLGKVESGEVNIGVRNLQKISIALKLPMEILFKGY